MLCRICTVQINVQIKPRKYVVDHADSTASTRQHELHHTDHTDHTDQVYIRPEMSVRCVEYCHISARI